jgi:hypothetical protein
MAKQEKPKQTILPQVDKTKIERFTKGGIIKTKKVNANNSK